ncbi:hypothetical protein D3C87_1948490 [compost metagenome]
MDDVNIPDADALIGRFRFQQVYEIFEITHIPGPEIPAMVVGKFNVCRVFPRAFCGG